MSWVREPLIFKLPVVRLKLKPAIPPDWPLLTPGFNIARNSGLRPFNGRFRISFVVISLPTVAVSDCN